MDFDLGTLDDALFVQRPARGVEVKTEYVAKMCEPEVRISLAI